MDAEQRAALMFEVRDAINRHVGVDVTHDDNELNLTGVDEAVAEALAAVEAAGWRPPATPLTHAEVERLWREMLDVWHDGGVVGVVNALLRHPLLAARGMRLEG